MIYFALLSALILVIVIISIINSSYASAVKKAQSTLINALTQAVILVDHKQKISVINTSAQKFTGVPLDNSLNQPIDSVLPIYTGSNQIPFTTYIQDANNPDSQSNTYQFKKADGSTIDIMLRVTKYTLGTDDKGYILTLHDISQEQQLEEMKVDFVSMAAHELRTPLTAIRGYASLMQMHYAAQLDTDAKELLIRLLVSTTNLANLIDNLLSVSRIERNNLTIEAQLVDLKAIIQDIFSSFEQQAQTKKQKFTLTVPDKMPLVMADPFRIGQVFINLISNALTYTPEGGSITVRVVNHDGMLEVTIQDTGEGIPPEAMPRLFTKFFRVSGSLEQGSKGTGLGLYITKSIVEMHKGKIRADSVLGKGSTFTFTLPTATQEQLTTNGEKVTAGFLTVKNGQGIIVKKIN